MKEDVRLFWGLKDGVLLVMILYCIFKVIVISGISGYVVEHEVKSDSVRDVAGIVGRAGGAADDPR